jgi:hypothetical protein
VPPCQVKRESSHEPNSRQISNRHTVWLRGNRGVARRAVNAVSIWTLSLRQSDADLMRCFNTAAVNEADIPSRPRHVRSASTAHTVSLPPAQPEYQRRSALALGDHRSASVERRTRALHSVRPNAAERSGANGSPVVASLVARVGEKTHIAHGNRGRNRPSPPGQGLELTTATHKRAGSLPCAARAQDSSRVLTRRRAAQFDPIPLWDRVLEM